MHISVHSCMHPYTHSLNHSPIHLFVRSSIRLFGVFPPHTYCCILFCVVSSFRRLETATLQSLDVLIVKMVSTTTHYHAVLDDVVLHCTAFNILLHHESDNQR
uniref:Uncharacterized protein n=1 Tax=Craspedostauros australis TaxID=1486917 RepID=A0A7R9WNG9_9STRA|mmetsp:Transcript_11812/g.32535  ORF Transcript_11812/g.32535 Transcript_11812/m.32535 type:complete len:103 (+) Transcript_11812:427-735(+)